MKPVTIQLDGPSKNALSTSMMRWIREQLARAGGAPVLLTGAGDAFCAGLDLKEVVSLDLEGMRAFLAELDAVVEALYHYPGPVVGLINGHAIAGGSVLALCCDHSVAADNPRARIGLNEVAIGLQFPPNILSVVRATVPPRHLGHVLLAAELHGPHDACALGLVSEVSAEAAEVAAARLEVLASRPVDAFRGTKRALRSQVVFRSMDEHGDFAASILPAWSSNALKDRLRAVLKR